MLGRNDEVMLAGHATARLGDLCEVIRGSSPRPKGDPRYFGGDIPWVLISDVTKAPGRFLTKTAETVTDAGKKRSRYVEPGQLIVTNSATIGLPIFMGIGGCIHDGFLTFPKVDKRLTLDWLYWYFLFSRKRLARLAPEGTQKNLNIEIVENITIPLPDLSEQRRIAGELEKADELRRTRRYALELTETFLPAAFLELFGDPIDNHHGFPIEPLEDLIQPTRPISYGILMPGPDVPNGVPYIRVTDIQDGRVVTALVRRTTPEIDQAYKRSKLKAGDLLLSIRGHVGRMAIVPQCLDGANITQDTARLATVDSLESDYLMGCLASPGMQHRMVGLTRGAAVQGINLGDVKELPIPVPPLVLQQKFAALVERLEHLKAVQREALRQAEHLFASLLDDAFSG